MNLVNNFIRIGFSSAHAGGAHFLIGDGSVRFISENIDSFDFKPSIGLTSLGTYQRLSLVADGPLIQVSGRVASSTATASGTIATTCAARTTTRW